MNPWIATPEAMAALPPLLARWVAETGAAILDADNFDAWARRPGVAMVVFAEDPDRFLEMLDLTLVVPELQAIAGPGFRIGLLPPAASRRLAPRFAFESWPDFLMLRDGQLLGAVQGITDRGVYLGELRRLLAAGPSSPLPTSADGPPT